MELSIERIETVTIARPRIDKLMTPESIAFVDDLEQLLEHTESHLVINFAAIELIDSRGLGAILSLLQRKPTDVDVFICEPTEHVLEAMQMVKLDKIIEVFDSEEDAVASAREEAKALSED